MKVFFVLALFCASAFAQENPAYLNATAYSEEVALDWPASGYGVYVVWAQDAGTWFPIVTYPGPTYLRTETNYTVTGLQPGVTYTFGVSAYPFDIGPTVTVTTIAVPKPKAEGTTSPLCSVVYKVSTDQFIIKAKIGGIAQYDHDGDGVFEYPNYGYVAGKEFKWSNVYPNPVPGAQFRILNASAGENCTVQIKID